MSKIENNRIYYDAYNEIRCDKFALEKFVKESEEKDKKIADLEAKLAESEEQRQHLKNWLDDEILTSVDHESYYATVNEYEEEVKKLKQQLAEKDEEIKVIDEDRQFKAEMWTKFADKCKELEKQLAEKEKERHEEWKTGKEWKWEWQKVNQQLEQANQDKISFAVEQLEKVKEYYTTPIYDIANPHTDVRVLLQRIDNQINVLKEMK